MTAPVPNPYFLYAWGINSSGGVDTTPIDNTGSDSGTVNYQNGWTPNYEYASTNPANLPVPRPQMNQVLLDITYALQQLQTQGYPLWVAPATGSPPVGGPASYPIYATVAYNAGSGIQLWQSLIASNTSVPGADNNWLLISGNAQGVPTGTSIEFCGLTAPAGYLVEDGSAVSRTTYANLLSVLSQIQSCTTTMANANLTVVDSSKMYIGMALEGAGISTNTTILSITNSTTIVMSANATASATVNVQFFNWGNGDGSTTFNVPNSPRTVSVAAGGTGTSTLGNVVGQSGGSETVTLSHDQIPAHTHPGLWAVYSGGAPLTSGAGIGLLNSAISTGNNTPNGASHNNMQPSLIKLRCIKY
jgi:hypothetical protein